MNTTPPATAATVFPSSQCCHPTNTSSNRKVGCMYTAIPASVPSLQLIEPKGGSFPLATA